MLKQSKGAPPPVEILPDMRFGRLIVIEKGKKGLRRSQYWVCKCDCSKITEVMSTSLRYMTRSCGCLRDEQARRTGKSLITHGHAVNGETSLTYYSWANMIQRCTNPNNPNYPEYGGSGITVCERWLKFENFFADMGQRPSKRHSLDRYPNREGNYKPGNARWATDLEQQRNRKNIIYLTHDGECLPLVVWAEKLQVNPRTLRGRFQKGWTAHRIITTPIRKIKRSKEG